MMSYQSKFNSVMSSTANAGFDMDFPSCEDVSSEANNAGPLTKAQKDLVEQIRSAGGVLRNSNAVDARTLNALVKKGVVSGSKDGFVLVDVSADADEIDTRFDGKTFDTESFRVRADKILGGWGWQGRFATAIGVNKQTVAKWAAGRLEVPMHVTALIESLEMMVEAGIPLPLRFQK